MQTQVPPNSATQPSSLAPPRPPPRKSKWLESLILNPTCSGKAYIHLTNPNYRRGTVQQEITPASTEIKV